MRQIVKVADLEKHYLVKFPMVEHGEHFATHFICGIGEDEIICFGKLKYPLTLCPKVTPCLNLTISGLDPDIKEFWVALGTFVELNYR